MGLETVQMNEHIQRGVDNEFQAIFEYSVEAGVWVDEAFLVCHPAHNWLAASCDGFVGDDGVVEIKCPITIKFEPPAYHLAQIQGQLEITDRDWCDYVQFCDGKISEPIRIVRDREWWERALPVLERFWRYVQDMDPPPRGSCKMPD